MEKIKTPPLSIIVMSVVLLAALVLGIKSLWTAGRAKPEQSRIQSPASTSGGEDMHGLVGKVARHILVKTGEDPHVTIIQEAQDLKMRNPAFYQDVKDGDVLLVWSDKAVLYSTGRDLILAVMPIVNTMETSSTAATNNEAAATSASSSAAEQATIEVRNGTTKAGLAKTMSQKLKQADLTVLKIGDAKLKNYEATIIVKTADKDLPQTMQLLESVTEAKQAPLPEGERASTADILVIVGSDFSQP